MVFEVALLHLSLPRRLLTACCDLLRGPASHERGKAATCGEQGRQLHRAAKLCPRPDTGASPNHSVHHKGQEGHKASFSKSLCPLFMVAAWILLKPSVAPRRRIHVMTPVASSPSAITK